MVESAGVSVPMGGEEASTTSQMSKGDGMCSPAQLRHHLARPWGLTAAYATREEWTLKGWAASGTDYAVRMGVVFFLLLAIVVLAIVGGAILGALRPRGLVGDRSAWSWASSRGSCCPTPGAGSARCRRSCSASRARCSEASSPGAFDVNWFIEFILAVVVAAVLIAAFGSTNRRSASGVTRPR